MQEGVDAPILVVADPDLTTPGVIRARELESLTFRDYRDLYDRRYNIDLIITLTPDQQILDDILASRPHRIRIMSQQVFEIFWNAIGSEERKLREQKTAIETILNGIQDFILVITPQMDIIEVNEAFLSKFEYAHQANYQRRAGGAERNRAVRSVPRFDGKGNPARQ